MYLRERYLEDITPKLGGYFVTLLTIRIFDKILIVCSVGGAGLRRQAGILLLMKYKITAC